MLITHILRTNGVSFFIRYPGRITSTTCGQFEGSLAIIATNGLCINVTNDARCPDLKIGETTKVYDGYKSKHLLYQGQFSKCTHCISKANYDSDIYYNIYQLRKYFDIL